MDNQDNLYATSDLRPLTPHVQGSRVEVDPGSSSETQTGFLPTHSSLDLLNVRRDLNELTGLFKEFVNYNIGRDKERSSSCTAVRPDQHSPTRRKRSYDEMSVCQTHNSFEHDSVSHTKCYPEAFSSVENQDAISSKRSKRVDIDSLFHVPSTVNSEASVPDLNMEEEVLDFVDNELSEAVLDKKGKGLSSDKLASKIEEQWKNPSRKAVAQVFKRHKHPLNLESISVPTMPKLIMKMPSFKDSVLARERKLYDVHHSVAKSSHIISTLADDLLLAEKNHSLIDTKAIVLKAFDALSFLSNASVNISNLRRLNIRPILNKDVQGLCDPTREVSNHLFGDDIEKRLKQERESARLASAATQPMPQSTRYRQHDRQIPVFNRRTQHSFYNGPTQQSFLEKGQKSRPYRRKQKPYKG